MAPQNIYDFSDKLNADKTLCKKFIREYVNNIVNNTDVDDIIASWADKLFEDLYSEANTEGPDRIVEEVASERPEWIKANFNVDCELANGF